jgi:hypothetical protein
MDVPRTRGLGVPAALKPLEMFRIAGMPCGTYFCCVFESSPGKWYKAKIMKGYGWISLLRRYIDCTKIEKEKGGDRYVRSNHI